jgi:hypothetical protein
MSSDEHKCKLCDGSRKIKLKCLVCYGDPDNNMGLVPCNKCDDASGYTRTSLCNSFCSSKEVNVNKASKEYGSGLLAIDIAWCDHCRNFLDPCKNCDATGLMCYLCSNTDKMEQWCPACILSGHIEVIKD